MKKLSCGVVILANDGEILVGHATRTPRWDIFKGGVEEGETPVDTARRELYEESGLVVNRSQLQDLGHFTYTPKKDLHLFLWRVSEKENPKNLKCTSYIKTETDSFPEFDTFAWMSVSEFSSKTGKSMGPIIELIVKNHVI
jgi:8-oxo-dGTP pyrophosphatase MutT (NUDIX family)